ncbi:MAG: protein kinase [Chloroflexota bacterium]|nr:protein kinase [Chloroflexota bacterium]
MNQQINFGQHIKDQRGSKGLTQAELARRVACATITIRKIEANDLRPSAQIAERIAMALDVPTEERVYFIRSARAISPDTPDRPRPPTPTPTSEEIGRADLSGRAVRGYELADLIGTGGFGVVYRATQPLIEREVAVKIILPKYANDPNFIRRFEAEARLVARLEHPYIVPLYDYWREPGAAYLVMRLLRGGNLHERIRENGGPLALDFILDVMNQVGAALHTAHRAGVIHRDLKPSNILLDDDDNAYLSDFGIAKQFGSPELARETGDEFVSGSPAYASPERSPLTRSAPRLTSTPWVSCSMKCCVESILMTVRHPGDITSNTRVKSCHHCLAVTPHYQPAWTRSWAWPRQKTQSTAIRMYPF